MKNVLDIVKKHKWKIILIYVYVFFAQIMFLAEPFFLGKTIDGILCDEYSFLFVLFGVYLLENFFMYKRMVYDTKVYLQIYNEIVADYLERDKESDTSSKIARTEMANNLVNFIENDLHYFIMAVMTMVGSLIFIFTENWKTGLVVLGCIVPTVFIVRKFYKKIAKYTRIGHTHYEDKFSIMESEDDSKIDTFFKRRKAILIAGSTLQGKHWASLNLNKSSFLVLALVIFTQESAKLSHGEAVAMFVYLNQFLNSLMSIPIAVETFTRIKDVIKRLK
jgi:ABC-type multidrug transport system fused ATPase/permease subunit